MKQFVNSFWLIERFIRLHIRLCRALHFRGGLAGRAVAAVFDRLLLILYGIDLASASIDAPLLSISHPSGVLLGGNGVVSRGRVAIMSGVKLVARAPDDPEYLRLHAERRVFAFGDNVVIGANSVVIGPVEICDNVVISAMSLVNRPITEPGLYAGCPVRKVRAAVNDAWVAHLPPPVPEEDGPARNG